eukprot:7537951-Heterocapsa_arctica.AAC.1
MSASIRRHPSALSTTSPRTACRQRAPLHDFAMGEEQMEEKAATNFPREKRDSASLLFDDDVVIELTRSYADKPVDNDVTEQICEWQRRRADGRQ